MARDIPAQVRGRARSPSAPHGEGARPHAPQAGRAVAPRPPPLVRLGEVCLSITDGSHNPPAGVQDSAYLMLSSKNVYDDSITLDEPRFLTERQFLDEDKRTRISSGDVLFTIVGTVGRAAVVPNAFPKICLQRSVAVLKPNTKLITSRFLMYQLQAMRSFFEQQARGVAQKGIYLKQLSACVLNALPPLPEQKRIAAILDKICEMKRNAEARLQKLDLLVKARFVEMFGEIKERIAIDDACVVLNGFAFKSNQYVSDGIRVIRIMNVQQGWVEDSDPKFYPSESKCEIEKYMLQEDDLLISLTGNVGHVALLPKELLPAGLNQRVGCLRIRTGVKLSKHFLFHALNNQKFERECVASARGVAQKNMSTEWLKQYRLPLPPLALQRQFAAFVEKVEGLKATAKKELEQVDLLYRAKLQEFFG